MPSSAGNPNPKMSAAADPPAESVSPIQLLPTDTLQKIFSLLPLRQALLCRSVCRSFRLSLLSPPPLPPLPLLAFRNSPSSSSSSSHHHHRQMVNNNIIDLVAFDPVLDSYLRFPLSFLLNFHSVSPIASSNSLLYVWAAPPSPDHQQQQQQKNPKSLIACNPVTRRYKVLPQLGSAWSRHGTVLVGPDGMVLVLTELAALFYSPVSKGASGWMKFSLNLPSKPRSPILVGEAVFTLCDVGSPWRSQWKLFRCGVGELKEAKGWVRLEKGEWGDVFDVLKRPRLVRGKADGEVLMVGGLRSSFAMDAPCSTVLILRLGLERMEWDEAGKMPLEMYKCFASGGGGGSAGGNNKVKVFGGEGRVWFSGKKVKGKMAMWEDVDEGDDVEGGQGGGKWRWVDGVSGYGDGVYRGFVFDAGLTEIP